MLKYVFKIFPLKVSMHGKTFAYLCRRTISPTYIIFSIVHPISDMNNIHTFEDLSTNYED